MFYLQEEKELLARYFKYYRKENNVTIKDIVSAGICDYKTYKNIEEGIIKKNDELYDKLLTFFNMDFSIIEILREVNPFIEKLYDACEWYDNEKILKIINRINNKVYHLKEKSLIHELVESIEIVKREYLANSYLNEQEILKTFKLIELWNNKLSSLLIEACGKSNINYVLSNSIFEIMQNIITQNDMVSVYWKARLYSTKVNYIEAIKLYESLLEYYKTNENHIRKIRVLMRMFNIYRDIDYAKAEEYAKIIENETANNLINNNMKCSMHYNLGMYYYLYGNYNKSLRNFENSFELEENMMAILFICSCRSHLKCLEDFKFDIDVNHTFYPYLRYFEMKASHENYIDLEKYIMNHLINKLNNEKYEEPFWNMFNYEMSELVKKTRNYKKYHKFQEKLQFATKKAA